MLEDSTTKNKVLMTTLYSQLTNLEAQKTVAPTLRKRGVERCFSTKIYANQSYGDRAEYSTCQGELEVCTLMDSSPNIKEDKKWSFRPKIPEA